MRETPAASVAQYTPHTPHRRDLDIIYFPVPLLVLFFVLCFLVVVLFRKTVERGGWQEGTGRLVRSVRDASGDREKSGWGGGGEKLSGAGPLRRRIAPIR